MDSTIKMLPIVKSLAVNREAHKCIKLESVEYDIPIQDIVEYKILKRLTKKEADIIRRKIQKK